MSVYRKSRLIFIVYILVLWLGILSLFINYGMNQSQENIEVFIIIVPISIGAIFGLHYFIKDYIHFRKEIPAIKIENDILCIDQSYRLKKNKVPVFQIKEVTMEHFTQVNNGRKSVIQCIKIKYYPTVVPKFITIRDVLDINFDVLFKQLKENLL